METNAIEEGERLNPWPALAWLMAAGLFARAWGLTRYTLSPDEVLILMISGRDGLSGVWQGLVTQAHPPLHFFLMHYLLMISRDIYFLKASSMLAGIALVPVLFFLGRRLKGDLLGFILAFMATFGYGAMQMAEVVRPYSLLALTLALAIWSFFSFSAEGKTRHAAGCAVFMLISLGLHYSAAMAAAAVGGPWLTMTALKRRPFKEWAVWCGVHVPLVLLALCLYYFHLSRISHSRQEWMEGYLNLGFSRNPAELLDHVHMLFSFLFHPAVSWLMMAASVPGLYALWKSSREAPAMIVTIMIAALALTLIHSYPLSGSRHNYYLFPFLALAAGSGLDYIFTVAAKPLARLAGRESLNLFQGERRGLIVTGLIIFLTLPVLARYSQSDFLREYKQAKISEFTLTRLVFDNAFKYLEQNVGPRDTVFCSGQAGGYIEFFAGPPGARPLSRDMSRIEYQGLTFHFEPDFEIIPGPEELRRKLVEFNRSSPINPDSTVWIMDIGYYNNKFKQSINDVFYPVLKQATMVEKESVVIYGIPAQALLMALDNGPGPEKE